MCGRYSLSLPPEALQALFDFQHPCPEISPRFNIAPTQLAPVVRLEGDGQRQLAMLRWGLIPRWAKAPAIGSRMINARSETVAEKPAFRNAFRKRRCLIPANGFYEWISANQRVKQPYYIYPADHKPLVMAGLWESWHDAVTSEDLATFTILTTEANAAMRQFHDRMPVFLHPHQFDQWLIPKECKGQPTPAPFVPAPDDLLAMHPVSRKVNSPAIDDASLIDSVEISPESSEPAVQQGWLFD